MGAIVYVRGWLEFNGLRDEAARVIGDDPGWSFPEGWFDVASYLRAVPAPLLADLEERVRAVAALPAADEDGDRVCGLFLVFHEVHGQDEWQVRDGGLHIRPAPPDYDYLWI
ncbi:hypothetical protein [Nonomuraea sp. NPDC049725]|uniref:hypothetical protein n=1 Tax=Nonomuraea sp. NPDC049725 TaxID=3154508 RepID=UPI0034266553